MKRNLLALTVASLCVLQLQAQNSTVKKVNTGSGVYIQLHGGYGLQTNQFGNQQDNLENVQSGSGFNTIVTSTFKKGGYGKGINAGITIGKEMSDNIALELGASYLLSSKQTINSFIQGNNSNTNEYKLNMINLVPSLVIKTYNEDGASLYAKFGPAIGIGGKITNVETQKSGSNTFETTTEFNKGLSIGIQSAIGLEYPFSDKLSLIAELNFRDQKFAPKKGKITKYTDNGRDDLMNEYPTIIDREIEFVNKVVTPTDNNNPNSPLKKTKEYSSLSSLGLNIGVRFKL